MEFKLIRSHSRGITVLKVTYMECYWTKSSQCVADKMHDIKNERRVPSSLWLSFLQQPSRATSAIPSDYTDLSQVVITQAFPMPFPHASVEQTYHLCGCNNPYSYMMMLMMTTTCSDFTRGNVMPSPFTPNEGWRSRSAQETTRASDRPRCLR